MNPVVRLAAAVLPLIGAAAPAADAREVTLTTQMGERYRGVGGYIIIYVTDTAGKYVRTLYAAGRSTRYYGQFRHWWRATEPISKRRHEEYDGITGASLERGETLTLSIDIADDLIDAGYVIKIDSSVQEGRDFPSDVVAPLETGAAGTPVAGRGYVASLTIDM